MLIDKPLPFALAIGTFAGLALFALHPNQSVQLEGEIAMLEPSLALQRLDAATNVEMHRNLALTHAALALEAGEFDVTRTVLRKLKMEVQDTVEIELMLANAGRLSGDPETEMDHLAAAYVLDPSSALRQRLGVAYRTYRQPAKERALLLSVPGDDLTSHEAKRLADLLRQSRQFNSLEALYRVRAIGDGPDADEAKQLYVNHLLESGRSAEAQTQALQWFEASRGDQHILEASIPAFIQWEALDSAMSLAVLAIQAGPKTSYRMIALFLNNGEQDSALAFQQAWLEHVRLIPIEAWPTLLDTAKQSGSLAGLRTALSKTAPKSLAADQLSDVMLQFLRHLGVQSLYPYSAYLRPDVLDTQPLVGAAWAANQSNQMAAVAYLLKASKNEMTEWDWQIWGNVARSLNGSSAYKILLANAPEDSRARSVLQQAFMVRQGQFVQSGSAEKVD